MNSRPVGFDTQQRRPSLLTRRQHAAQGNTVDLDRLQLQPRLLHQRLEGCQCTLPTRCNQHLAAGWLNT